MIPRVSGQALAMPVFRKLLRIMKLVTLFMLVASLHISAKGLSQEITFLGRNVRLEKVFSVIKEQTHHVVFFESDALALDKTVDIDVKKASLQQVLAICFKDQPVEYVIKGKNIFVTRKMLMEKISNAVPIDVTGQITDEKGTPMPGVTIRVKGSSKGVATDEKGMFKLNVEKGNVLEISFIGYQKQEITVMSDAPLKVSMTLDQGQMNEVVVVAYGTQKKVTLTGAVATIKTKEIKQSPAANLAVTLAGRLPGLFAQQTSGEPGRDATYLFMRGRGTLNSAAPIILVDGVERELTSIDPNEVETVSILKDASSTALFGVRGANGVILVTTKRGTETTPTISFTAETGFQTFTRWPSQVDGYNWATLKNQAWKNDNPHPEVNDAPPYSDYALERFRLQDWPEVYPNNNWRDKLMNTWVPQTRYNLNLNGKGGNVAYFVNVGFLDQRGQWKIDPSVTDYDPTQFMKRYNFRSNIDATLNKSKTLKTFLNASGYLEKVNGPNASSPEIVDRMLSYWPTVQPGPLTPDGQVLVGSGNLSESPWAYINRTGYRQESRSNLTASWGLEQDLGFLTKGLSTRVMFSFDTRSLYYLNGTKQYQYWVQVIDPNSQTPDGRDVVTYQRTRTDFDNTPLSTASSSNFQSFYEMQWHINYNRRFKDKHEVTGLLLAQQQSLIKPADALPFNVRGLATRLTYAYDNKYLAEFNAGFNGSEQFAKGKRYGFFPSFSAGWNVHHEAFFGNLVKTVSLLKIRGSYGMVGGDQLGNRRFLYLDDIQRGGGSYSANLGRGARINESFFGNPNIKWEVAKKGNVGLELGLFNQLTMGVDIFKERRDNVLIYRGTVPTLIGVSASTLAPANIGVVENKGYEIELNYNKAITKKLSIITKLNLNYADNLILFNDEIQLNEDYAYRYRNTGYQIGQQWGYQVTGFFKDQEEIDKSGLTYQGQYPRPGDFIYADLNADGIIDNRDMMPIGSSTLPKYNWGGAVSITYGNLDVSFLFQGAFKATGQFNPWELDDFRERHLHAWTPERAESGYEILYPALSLRPSSSQTSNTFFNENKSFIRLKNAEIGYNLPASLINKLSIRSVRIYANGLNLFTWDKMVQKDWDPELNNKSAYPVYRVVNFGITAMF
ncbi:TonB-dependent receptor [Chitinophaga defluvii]|uniref:TonB-dependent receptor n=1 Tax=Chitinophaga defluvii TaxID=3163343 RepID=A0ABV2TE25_9BACT